MVNHAFSRVLLSTLVVAGWVALLSVNCSDDDTSEADVLPDVATDTVAETSGDVPSETTDDSSGDTDPSSADLGFRPNPDGFVFENYINDIPGLTNLTPGELRRMFGDEVCNNIDGDVCLLTPVAQRWMDAQSEGMDNGHCEGMAVASLLFFFGTLTVTDYGASSAYGMSLEGNEALQREIGYWFITQGIPGVQEASSRYDPADAVTQLQQIFNGGTSGETYTLGIYIMNEAGEVTGGHAVMPYAVRDQGGGTFHIMVYDNNFPGEERAIVVDTNANTWEYNAAMNPNEEFEIWSGNLDNGNQIELTPTSSRAGTHACWFCAEEDEYYKSGDDPLREIIFDSEGDIVVVDSEDNRLGYVDGILVNEIPDAEVIYPRYTGVDYEPTFMVPLGTDLTATLEGTAEDTSESDISIFGQGYVLGAAGIELAADQTDEITFYADGIELLYLSDGAATPGVFIGVETETADYLFMVAAGGDPLGQGVHMWLDPDENELWLTIGGGDGSAEFILEITRFDETGETEFHGEGATVGDTDTLIILYGDWAGDGSPMTIEIDEGSDGSIDDTIQLDDM